MLSRAKTELDYLIEAKALHLDVTIDKIHLVLAMMRVSGESEDQDICELVCSITEADLKRIG